MFNKPGKQKLLN